MRISLAGSGNVATHIGAAFKNSGHVIREVWSRNPDHAALLAYHLKASVVTDPSQLGKHSDVVILAVSDDAIAALVPQIRVNALVAHTSGSTPMNVLAGCSGHIGVFYPLQTFSTIKEVDFKTVPVAVEGNTTGAIEQLTGLASSVSDRVLTLDSSKRMALHVAAVFAGNFTNHLYAIAAAILRTHELDFDLLQPLINETANKVTELSPALAQTGPARRNDQATLKKHLEFLQNEPGLLSLYQEFSQRIINFSK